MIMFLRYVLFLIRGVNDVGREVGCEVWVWEKLACMGIVCQGILAMGKIGAWDIIYQ
jgi:hypothetical protein